MQAFHRIGQNLARVSVAHQLFGAFLLLLTLMAALGATSIYGLTTLDKQAQALAEKWLSGVGHLATARVAANEARAFEVKHSRTDDASYHAEYQEKVAEANKQVTTALKDYEAKIDGDDERGRYAALTKSWSAYLDAQNKVIQAGKSGKATDAADLSDGVASMAIDETMTALDGLLEFNFAGGHAAGDLTSLVFHRARAWILGLLAVAMVTGVVLSLVITRRLLAQLGGEAGRGGDRGTSRCPG